MSLVAIIGAGEIGGAVAHRLVSRARLGVVRLIDEHAAAAAGKALDLAQSLPVSGSDARLESAGNVMAAAGAQVVILADPFGRSAWTAEAGLSLIGRMARFGCFDQALLICSGDDQRELVQLAIDEIRLPPERVIGSAPDALASAVRALVAIEAGAAASQVDLMVLGRPPEKIVIPWSSASVAGRAVEHVLSPPQILKIERRARALWPMRPVSLGTAAALVCEAAMLGSRRTFCAFAAAGQPGGSTSRVSAWPVSLDRQGLARVVFPVLSPRDRIAVDEVLQ